jgi:AcrR family transcriptional regulator
MTEKKQRLGRQEWIDAGFRALVMQGPEGLRVELIAKALGVTKGSFYWHFKDLSALQDAMLAYWEDAATHRIIARAEALPPGLPRLAALAEAINLPHDAQGGAGAETAIRGWGFAFAPAGTAVARVDEQRLAFLQTCLNDMNVEASQNAALIYAAHLGLEQLSLTSDISPVEAMLQLIKMISAEAG